jgi:hypothetical protein
MSDATHKPYWSVVLHAGEWTLASPQFESEGEARKAFQQHETIVPNDFPESYAVVLWECQDGGPQSAVLSKVVSLPKAAPEVFSPSF